MRRASTVRARFRRAPSRTWPSVIFPATSTPTTPPSPSSANVIWMRSLVCSRRHCCCVRRSWLVKLGHVAIDGTKIKANASKHKAMSYKRMNETETRLKQEIDALLAKPRKRPMPKRMRSTARIGAATNCLPSYSGVRAGCGRSARPRQRWNRQAKRGRAATRETEQKLAERAEEERRTGKKKRGASR
jgi:hypothetical protein